MSPDRVGHPAAGSPRHIGFFERHAGKFGLSLLITFGIWYALHQGGLKFLPEGGDFQHVKWWVFPVYFANLLAMTWFRAIRWRYLLRSIAEIPNTRLFSVSCVSFAAIAILPFRIGEIVRPLLIRTPPRERTGQRVGRPITLAAATSSVVAERVIDGLYLSIVLALALWLVPTVHPLPDRVVGIPVSVAKVRLSGFAMPALFTVALMTIAFFYFARSWAHRITFVIVGRFSERLAGRLTRIFENLADGLHVLSRGSDALGFFLETTLYWGLNVLGLWLILWGCGVTHLDGTSPSFGESCSLMGMLGATILIPGPPGMLGVFQAGLYAAMTMYYPTQAVTGAGAAFVFLIYASQMLFIVVAGGVALLFERGGVEALEQA